ncbi:LCP family protein [Kitasatospora sp. DSM 101779]|uniref:LCP family protein n=1 Tax=Kitasatospora sp. DSM 101779 TaxID=2853165 RepID=UPI0021D91A05|nr:LCP family protein [Kitasatospora sp. DSM 101779]MCU7824839.1 LytR C-terminal domain-containing protein [Kitasatospora sp. DSM 101779]
MTGTAGGGPQGYQQDPYGQGYDPYDPQGWPQEQQPPQQQGQQQYGYDPYAGYQEQQPQAYQQDPYGQGASPQHGQYPQQGQYPQDPYQQQGQQAYYQQHQHQHQQQPQGWDPYAGQGGQQGWVQDPYQQGAAPQQQPGQQPARRPPVQQPPLQQVSAATTAAVAAAAAGATARAAAPAAPVRPAQPSEQVGGSRQTRRPAAGGDNYATGEFTFVDEEAEESEDVIDWLKFAESRSEVRAERRRRLRNRLIGLAVAGAIVAGGVGGWMWWTGRDSGGSAAAAAGGRQVNVVHLRDLQGKVSTALLVNDASGHKGTVLLIPDSLRLPNDSTVTTVGKGMDDVGPSGTREGLATVLGAPVAGTWRLDTPYLTLLVAQLGGIKVDTNAEVKAADGKVLASAGKGVSLNGQAAVAYATLQAPGETRDAQLARFGQVMEAVLRAMPTDLDEATVDVHRMNAVLDPSLPEKALAGVLVQLALHGKDGHLGTQLLKAKPDGTLDEATAGRQVKDVLGGTIKNATAAGGTARVSVLNASGQDKAAESASVQITNTGMEVVPSSGKAGTVQATSEIRYTDDARAEAAKTLAGALGLKPEAVKKVTDPQNADLVVVLGKDYKGLPDQKTDQKADQKTADPKATGQPPAQ